MHDSHSKEQPPHGLCVPYVVACLRDVRPVIVSLIYRYVGSNLFTDCEPCVACLREVRPVPDG